MVDINFSRMVDRLKSSEIRELLKLTRTRDVISFAGGLPDPRIFPYAQVKQAADRAIDELGFHALQYSPTDGEPFLKEQIAVYMNRQGESISPEDLMIVSSSQQALDLLGKIFINAGDPIVLELPSYLGALQAFRSYGVDFHGIEMDDGGVIPEMLESEIVLLRRLGKKPKFIYLIPDFQNPSGITLTFERRLEILRIAARHDLLIVEDSPYRELRFKGDLIPSLYSLDKDGRVIQLKTFSKIFCPGFRIGWLTGPRPVLDKLIIAKQSADLCTSAFVSIVSAFFIKEGHLEKLIAAAREIYRRKSAVMLQALEEFMPPTDGLTWSRPDGGMFLWLRLPKYMDATEMIVDAIEEGVAYVIGQSFYCDNSGANTLRLNFSFPTEEQIITGIQRLARLVSVRLSEQSAVESA